MNPKGTAPHVAAREERMISEEILPCGVEVLSEIMPGYHTATVMIRLTGGLVSEPPDQLGLAYVTEQAVDKGTSRQDARTLANAFDAIGAHYSVHTGLESWVFVVSALPEFIGQAASLLGEIICEPLFPDEIVNTAVNLTTQELTALEDSAQAVLRREMARQAYGEVLGRHRLGRRETLSAITPDRVRSHWKGRLSRKALTIALAGNCNKADVLSALDQALARAPDGPAPKMERPFAFEGKRTHLAKELEQTQIGVSFPGVPYGGRDYLIEKTIIEILSGGMGARLFTEVREKQGLVYWVGAWHEQPRALGMIHIGAATTPERCHRTLDTLLHEVNRLEHDLTEDELQRAKTGILAEKTTTGASVHQRAGELLRDHFHLGKAVPASERVSMVKSITIEDIKQHLSTHPREQLSIVTVGPRPIEEEN